MKMLVKTVLTLAAVIGGLFGIQASTVEVRESEFNDLMEMAGPGIPCPDKGSRAVDELEG